MMAGKVSIKTILVLIILVVIGVLSVLGVNTVKTYLSGAAAGYEPKNVYTNPKVSKDSNGDKSVLVTWTTEKPAMSIVEYGSNPASLLLKEIEPEATTDHRISLKVKAGNNRNYYFRIKVGEEVFDNNGIPYSFQTKDDEAQADAAPSEETGKAKQEPAAVIPTSVPTSSPVSSNCNGVDFNHDGTVNSLDMIQCQAQGGGSTVAGSSTSTGSSTPATSCEGVDFNNDGVINSLDRITCLQNARP